MSFHTANPHVLSDERTVETRFRRNIRFDGHARIRLRHLGIVHVGELLRQCRRVLEMHVFLLDGGLVPVVVDRGDAVCDGKALRRNPAAVVRVVGIDIKVVAAGAGVAVCANV